MWRGSLHLFHTTINARCQRTLYVVPPMSITRFRIQPRGLSFIPTTRTPVFHRLSTLSVGTCYDAMGADPRLAFSGAPSTDINTGVSNFLGWIRRIVITNGRRSVRAYFSDNCECMIKNEEATLPNGTTYKLTTTWAKEPRESIEVPEEQ